MSYWKQTISSSSKKPDKVKPSTKLLLPLSVCGVRQTTAAADREVDPLCLSAADEISSGLNAVFPPVRHVINSVYVMNTNTPTPPSALLQTIQYSCLNRYPCEIDTRVSDISCIFFCMYAFELKFHLRERYRYQTCLLNRSIFSAWTPFERISFFVFWL